MSLLMTGQIDAVFRSEAVIVTASTSGGWDNDGNLIPPSVINESYTANIQPLNQRELQNLLMAGERIVDGRKIYINSGDFSVLKLANNIEMLGQKWKIVASDVREWRKYAKIIVSRYDDQ